jgi:hypothetical protein
MAQNILQKINALLPDNPLLFLVDSVTGDGTATATTNGASLKPFSGQTVYETAPRCQIKEGPVEITETLLLYRSVQPLYTELRFLSLLQEIDSSLELSLDAGARSRIDAHFEMINRLKAQSTEALRGHFFTSDGLEGILLYMYQLQNLLPLLANNRQVYSFRLYERDRVKVQTTLAHGSLHFEYLMMLWLLASHFATASTTATSVKVQQRAQRLNWALDLLQVLHEQVVGHGQARLDRFVFVPSPQAISHDMARAPTQTNADRASHVQRLNAEQCAREQACIVGTFGGEAGLRARRRLVEASKYTLYFDAALTQFDPDRVAGWSYDILMSVMDINEAEEMATMANQCAQCYGDARDALGQSIQLLKASYESHTDLARNEHALRRLTRVKQLYWGALANFLQCCAEFAAYELAPETQDTPDSIELSKRALKRVELAQEMLKQLESYMTRGPKAWCYSESLTLQVNVLRSGVEALHTRAKEDVVQLHYRSAATTVLPAWSTITPPHPQRPFREHLETLHRTHYEEHVEGTLKQTLNMLYALRRQWLSPESQGVDLLDGAFASGDGGGGAAYTESDASLLDSELRYAVLLERNHWLTYLFHREDINGVITLNRDDINELASLSAETTREIRNGRDLNPELERLTFERLRDK